MRVSLLEFCYVLYLGEVYCHANLTDNYEIVAKGFYLNAELIKAGLAA